MTDGNRPVRTRMPGGVGGAGSIPVPTRLAARLFRSFGIKLLSFFAVYSCLKAGGQLDYYLPKWI